jgi:hypothetical protein
VTAVSTATRPQTRSGRRPRLLPVPARCRRVPLPALLLGALLAALAVYVVAQRNAYPHTWDEPLQDWYGTAVLHWYLTGGHDLTFMHADKSLYMPEHGPFFETVVAAVQHVREHRLHAGHHWQSRALVCGMAGLAGIAGIAGIALCGTRCTGSSTRSRRCRSTTGTCRSGSRAA